MIECIYIITSWKFSFVLSGYTIPKGTTIFGSLYLVLMDPQNFPDPRTFKPERFLNEDGTKTIKSEHLVPFGIGE